jgi:signal transduction histidine kinase
MSLPGGIRTKLALALLSIVAGALVAAYLIVVPTLRDSLVDAKLQQLEADAVGYATNTPANSLLWEGYADDTAYLLDGRVVIYTVFTPEPLTLAVRADSRHASSRDVESDEVAARAALTLAKTTGTVFRGGQSFAEVAFPLGTQGPIFLASASLEDQEATVAVVKRRFLIAAAVASLIALGLGLGVAGMHARRIRRLERGAERIAGGRFDEPVVDGGDDELGQLARGFERMRVQLAQLDSARKEFIANASHELRTPLFSLGGFLELMTDEELDEETRTEFLATMREQVDRLTKLATDLLDLSRVDAGRLRVEHERVDLAETVRVLADELRGLAGTRDHPLVLDVEREVLALGDEERVLQVGRALAGNALVHTPPGTRVVVGVRYDGDRAVLSVSDDGPGIAPEHAEQVFDRFYRVDGGVASGSGLGLAIARELAELMGGAVTLESRPGRTVFTLELAAAASERAASREPALV